MTASLFVVASVKNLIAAENQVVLSIARVDGKKGKSDRAMVVPVLTEAEIQGLLLNSVGKAWIADAVDGLRSKMASKESASVMGRAISSDTFTNSAILAAMSADLESTRLTKESIAAWFDADMAPLVVARLQEKIAGIADDKLAKLVAGYKESFCAVSGRSGMSPKLVEQLQAALTLFPDDYDSLIAAKIATKLEEITEPDNLIDLL
jgi:hypothetical protein